MASRYLKINQENCKERRFDRDKVSRKVRKEKFAKAAESIEMDFATLIAILFAHFA